MAKTTVKFNEPTITLELTYQEAMLVRHCVGSIKGHGPVRELGDNIFDSLTDSGLNFPDIWNIFIYDETLKLYNSTAELPFYKEQK